MAKSAKPRKKHRSLQAERDSLMALEIVEAMKRSGKSYDELMTFLKAS